MRDKGKRSVFRQILAGTLWKLNLSILKFQDRNPKNCQNRLPAKGGTLTQKQPRTIKNALKGRFFDTENQQRRPEPKNARGRRGTKNTANTAEPSGAQGGTLTL